MSKSIIFKNLILAAILVLLAVPALRAQGDSLNLEKYWLYRQRLLNTFVKVGPAAGEGIPAAVILQFREVLGNKGVTWAQSDGTISLGWYIAVLGSEHGLLVKNGLPTTDNVEELYYALNALWRLDAQSDFYDYTPGNWPACTTLQAGAPTGPMSATDFDDDNLLDGYAIRSDAPLGFQANFPGMDNVTSEVLSPFGHNCRAKEMSQDQGIFLIMGLMAVKKWVAPEVEFNGVPLRKFAIKEGVRIVTMMQSPPRKDWRLRNPKTDSIVPIGDSGIGWRYPKAKMAEALLDSPGAFHAGAPNRLWLAQGIPVSFGIEMTLGMAGAMAAVGNSWGDQTAACLNRYAVQSTANEQGRDREIYYAFHHLLYGSPLEDTYVSAKIYKRMLDLAPCDGPHSTWPDPAPFFGWTTDSRFTGMNWPKADIDGDGDKELYNQLIAGAQGTCCAANGGDIYPGLDYMFLFNLYYLMYDGTAYDPEGEWKDLLHSPIVPPCDAAMSSLQIHPFPNPSDGQFRVAMRIPEPSTVKLELLGADGRVKETVFRSASGASGDFSQDLDLRALAAGVYVLRVVAGEEVAYCRIAVVK